MKLVVQLLGGLRKESTDNTGLRAMIDCNTSIVVIDCQV